METDQGLGLLVRNLKTRNFLRPKILTSSIFLNIETSAKDSRSV